METQAVKIKRSNFVIKTAMVLVVVMEALSFYQTNTLNFGAISTSIGILALLRGLLLSPLIFSAPIKSWFKENNGVNSDSHKYFILALVFILIGMVRYI